MNSTSLIALCCELRGGQGAVDMALVAEAKESGLRNFLSLARRHAQPRPAGCSTIWIRISFAILFQRFTAQFSELLERGGAAIDGEVLRRSFDHASGKSVLRSGPDSR
jgi:hypothetical protein